MIIAKLDDEKFLDTVRNAGVIAFQQLEYGFAVAAAGIAFYAPLWHPGGGNFHPDFGGDIAEACLKRMSDPHLRTLRPTAKPSPTAALLNYLANTFADDLEFDSRFKKAAGDHPAVVDSECQVVIQAIEEFERPDLKDAMIPGKRDALSDALDMVILHAEAAREFAEVGDYKPESIRLHILQASTAMKSALTYLLKP